MLFHIWSHGSDIFLHVRKAIQWRFCCGLAVASRPQDQATGHSKNFAANEFIFSNVPVNIFEIKYYNECQPKKKIKRPSSPQRTQTSADDFLANDITVIPHAHTCTLCPSPSTHLHTITITARCRLPVSAHFVWMRGNKTSAPAGNTSAK